MARSTSVMVFNQSPQRIKRALKLLDSVEKGVGTDKTKVRKALQLYDILERFFKKGGRFKKKYTRKKTAAEKKKL